MFKVWREISPYWHILTGLAGLFVAAVLWVNDVSSLEPRLTAVERRAKQLEDAVTRIDYNTQQTAIKVGVRPLLPPKEFYRE